MYKNLGVKQKIMLTFGIGITIAFSLFYLIYIRYGMSGTPGAALTVLISLIVIFLALMLGEWGIARTVLNPVLQLTGHARKLASGDLDFKVETDRTNEMGQLSIAFGEVQNEIKKILSEVIKFEQSVSSGNLTLRADTSLYQGDFREIAGGLNNIMDMISNLVQNVKDSASLVAAESNDISSGAQIMAQGASEQASSVEEISVTVDNMSKYMKKTSDNAATAEELSGEVLRQAEAGNSNMDRLLVKLNEINVSSASISKIIKNIEDIAFQTNILALNAAVEAARAGAAGKGFAVVATEVKNLAAKSSEAAQETSVLLNDSISMAKDGLEIGETAHISLQKILTSIGQTTQAISQIAADAKHQAETVEQINSGLAQVSAVVQNNTATAEQSASSSQEMAAQAAILNELVSKYRFSEGTRKPKGGILLSSAS
ncbi:MAG: HAMP domain-containing protein [Clostridiales bacterium]|nr:HAMP domain-containing protein [Clostridiales bacterium]